MSRAPPEHPTEAMIEAMVRMHRTPRAGPDETLVHDIWQSGCDAWLNEQAIAASVAGRAGRPRAERQR